MIIEFFKLIFFIVVPELLFALAIHERNYDMHKQNLCIL